MPACDIAHVYSPALWRMGYYDTDPAGLPHRRSISYPEEPVPAFTPPDAEPSRRARRL